ncbi:hypothetical protein SLS60_000456 [Paraconiothyrium brasiliense]|uniref:DUF6594 domain-containing protein n=1 Tax=Paraconiothyrium brasiliense TaxID=300254 RepID=A0ABR3S6H3_9PLEO
MFRTFRGLNAENLLYYQAELTMLEKKLTEQQHVDFLSNDPHKKRYALDWQRLSVPEAADTMQLDLILRIRQVLKEYNDALIQQAQIFTYPEPQWQDLNYMQNFLHSEMSLALCGADAVTWGQVSARKGHSPNLITLCPRPKEDGLTNYITSAAGSTTRVLFRLGLYRFLRPSRMDAHNMAGYRKSRVAKITYWMTSTFAYLVPVWTIFVLFFTPSVLSQLSLVAAFNVLLSTFLSGMTDAKPLEIFAITAA